MLYLLFIMYYKSRLELKSNSSEVLPVIADLNVIRLQVNLTKLKLEFIIRPGDKAIRK